MWNATGTISVMRQLFQKHTLRGPFNRARRARERELHVPDYKIRNILFQNRPVEKTTTMAKQINSCRIRSVKLKINRFIEKTRLHR